MQGRIQPVKMMNRKRLYAYAVGAVTVVGIVASFYYFICASIKQCIDYPIADDWITYNFVGPGSYSERTMVLHGDGQLCSALPAHREYIHDDFRILSYRVFATGNFTDNATETEALIRLFQKLRYPPADISIGRVPTETARNLLRDWRKYRVQPTLSRYMLGADRAATIFTELRRQKWSDIPSMLFEASNDTIIQTLAWRINGVEGKITMTNARHIPPAIMAAISMFDTMYEETTFRITPLPEIECHPTIGGESTVAGRTKDQWQAVLADSNEIDVILLQSAMEALSYQSPEISPVPAALIEVIQDTLPIPKELHLLANFLKRYGIYGEPYLVMLITHKTELNDDFIQFEAAEALLELQTDSPHELRTTDEETVILTRLWRRMRESVIIE